MTAKLARTGATVRASARLLSYRLTRVIAGYTLIEPYLVNPGTFPAPGKGKGSCSTFTFPDNSLNCQVELCPDEDIPIRTSRVQLAYSILMATCDPNGAGGTYITPDPDGFRFTAELNPDFAVEPPSAVAFNATQGTHAKDIFKRQQDSVRISLVSAANTITNSPRLPPLNLPRRTRGSPDQAPSTTWDPLSQVAAQSPRRWRRLRHIVSPQEFLSVLG